MKRDEAYEGLWTRLKTKSNEKVKEMKLKTTENKERRNEEKHGER